MSALPPKPQWRVGDFNSDMHRLTALMNVICNLQFDRSVDEVVPHVDELLWIANEMVAGLTAHDDAKYAHMTGGRRNG